MNAQTNQRRHRLRLMAGIAVFLFSSAGIALGLGWFPGSSDGPRDILALTVPVASAKPVPASAQAPPAQVEGKSRARGRCAECGVVVSTREIDAHDESNPPGTPGGAPAGSDDGAPVTSTRRHEITIRLVDRSSRVLTHAGPAGWRPGERVIVIDGAKPSHR